MTGATDGRPADAEISEALVRGLLRDQHPDLADRPMVELGGGWDNVLFRLGTDLVVRLPRRELAAPLTEHEQRWLPELAPDLPLPVPTPVRIGDPGRGYPWRWTIARWFSGRPAIVAPPADPARAARRLGAFLAALHQPAPADAPPNPYRGITLVERDALTRGHIDQLGAAMDRDRIRASWSWHVDLPRWEGPPLWLHGDLHPANVIVHHGEIVAIVDFGDITAGDPATDLAIAWMLLPPAARSDLRGAAGVDEATWQRGRGWALALGLAYLASPLSTPDFAALGAATIDAVLADPDARPRP